MFESKRPIKKKNYNYMPNQISMRIWTLGPINSESALGNSIEICGEIQVAQN